MAGKLFKFLKKIKLNRKSENLLKKSHPIKTDKFDNTIGLQSWKAITDDLNEHDIIASNLNMEYSLSKARYCRSTADLCTSSNDTTRSNHKVTQLMKHQSMDVLDSKTSSFKTIDVDEILYSDLKSNTKGLGSIEESHSSNNSEFSDSNSSEFTGTYLVHRSQPLEYSNRNEKINHSLESEETNEEQSSFTHVTENVYTNIEETSSDEMSAISVTELCESIRLISAFGSLPDLPANYTHRPLLSVNNTPGRNATKQTCQYCQQVCKNRAGLMSHQRMSKLCQVKQKTMNFFHVQVQTVYN